MQHAGGSGALSSCAMSCQEQLPPEDSEQEEMEDLEDLELEELEELDPLWFVYVFGRVLPGCDGIHHHQSPES